MNDLENHIKETKALVARLDALKEAAPTLNLTDYLDQLNKAVKG